MIPLTQSGCNVFTKTFYLAFVAWREARSSKLPDEARLGVMFTLLDRVAHPKWWGRTTAECATKALQFSSLTDPKDKQLTTWPVESDQSWFNCLALAQRVIYGEADNPVPGADHYFDDSITPPDWADPKKIVKRIGRLTFYDLDEDVEAKAIAAAAPANSADPFVNELRAFLSAPAGGGA